MNFRSRGVVALRTRFGYNGCMHELSVAQSMMTVALDNAAANNAKKIIRIGLVVGKMSGVSVDALRFAFDAVKADTIASGAELVIEETAADARCGACGNGFEAGQYDFQCPSCGAPVFPKGGDELYVKELEIE